MAGPARCTTLLLLLAVVVAGWAACAEANQHLILKLGVQPDGSLDYGGRHITMATMEAPSREAAAAFVKECGSKLASGTRKPLNVGWVMKGPPANCLGHIHYPEIKCRDNKDWNLTGDGYGMTPTISIASDMLDAYGECLYAKSLNPGTSGITMSVKGPRHTDKKTPWHVALYRTKNAQSELQGFVSRNDRWVPYLNGRVVASPSCPASLTPNGAPGPSTQRCWLWTPVPLP